MSLRTEAVSALSKPVRVGDMYPDWLVGFHIQGGSVEPHLQKALRLGRGQERGQLLIVSVEQGRIDGACRE